MKIIILVLLSCIAAYGQSKDDEFGLDLNINSDITVGSDLLSNQFGVVYHNRLLTTYVGQYYSVIDTVIMYQGDCVCKHEFVGQDLKITNLVSCGVNHGDMRCPQTWLDEKLICTKCLKHIRIKETVHKMEKPISKYDECLNRLNAITNGKYKDN